MPANQVQQMVWNEPGYLGCGNLYRPGDIAPALTLHVVRCDDGQVRYRDTDNTPIILKPTDRKSARIVMEDDTPDRIEALQSALQLDRWTQIDSRG